MKSCDQHLAVSDSTTAITGIRTFPYNEEHIVLEKQSGTSVQSTDITERRKSGTRFSSLRDSSTQMTIYQSPSLARILFSGDFLFFGKHIRSGCISCDALPLPHSSKMYEQICSLQLSLSLCPTPCRNSQLFQRTDSKAWGALWPCKVCGMR